MVNGTKKTLFTVSWDDGYPDDLRVAEIMARYGIKGTFHVPLRNREGLPVMTPENLRQLATLHEVSSHTFSHCYLNTLSITEAEREISSGKAALEDALGHPVSGFCYPGGKYSRAHVALVKKLGFSYARSCENFRTDLEFDKFTMPTTLQVYPHQRLVYFRNFLSKGHWQHRTALFSKLMRSNDLLNRMVVCFHVAQVNSSSSIVHFWGHSWELDKIGGWNVLKLFFQYVAEQPEIIKLENRELAMLAHV
jgi:hypothetical protein